MNKNGKYVRNYEPIRKRNKKKIKIVAKLMLWFICLYAAALVVSTFN